MSKLVVISVLWKHNSGTTQRNLTENPNLGKSVCLTHEFFF